MNLRRLFRRARAKTLAVVLITGSCVFPASTQAQSAGDWQPLFNGKDLSGWEIVTYPWKQEDNYDVTEFGVGKDPLGVFSVNDQGEMYITGQVYGGISTMESYRDYHFRLQMKWGEKKWPPRANAIRDSGILYHCRLPHQVFWKVWLGSLEYQIQEGDLGDYYRITIPKIDTLKDSDNRYNGDGELVKSHNNLRASLEPDAPHGEWNTCEVITRGNEAVHIANGYVVFRLWNAVSDRPQGPNDPKPEMDEGMIQIQAEGAEAYYRNFELRQLDDKALAKQVPAFKAELAKDHIHSTGPENGVTVTYTNQGDEAVDIVAIELYGEECRSFFAEKPAYPITLGPNGSTSFKVYLRKDAKGSGASVKARIETLAGPSAETVEIAAHK